MDKRWNKTAIQKNRDADLLYDWDLVPSVSTLKLFHADTRLKDAQRETIIKRIEVSREEMTFFCEWQDIKFNKRKLKHQILASDKTICDNRASKFRFHQKTEEFLHAQASVQNEIDHIKEEIKKYSETKEKMEKYVSLYSERFQSFLERVAQKDQEFNSVQDILIQYEELENCKNDCAHLLEKEMAEALELKRDLIKLVEEKSSRLKLLDNSLVLLYVRQKKAADKRKQWNNVVTNLEQVIATRLEESVTLKEGCYDLYGFICKRGKKKPLISKEDTKNQMCYIEKSILFYKDVIHLAAALQQYPTQQVQNENSECKSNFVKITLDELVNKSIENIERQ